MVDVDKVRQIAYDIHLYFGSGFLEKVYENSLVNRLKKSGFEVEQQSSLCVYDEDGTKVGDYIAALIVNKELIIEIKAVKTISPAHIAQTLNYLKCTGIKEALLINFGSYKFEIKKLVL